MRLNRTLNLKLTSAPFSDVQTAKILDTYNCISRQEWDTAYDRFDQIAHQLSSLEEVELSSLQEATTELGEAISTRSQLLKDMSTSTDDTLIKHYFSILGATPTDQDIAKIKASYSFLYSKYIDRLIEMGDEDRRAELNEEDPEDNFLIPTLIQRYLARR